MSMTLNPVQPSPDQETTSTAQDTVTKQNTQDDKEGLDPKVKKLHEEFKQRIDVCKIYRRKLIANWTVSIDYRRGKPFSSQTDDDQVAVNLDWSLTKAKQAALFSQVPQIRIDHAPETLPQAAPWLYKFEHKLNDLLVESGIETAMDECLPDCINAAGIGVVLVSFESITEDRQIPKMDTSDLEDDEADEVHSKGTLNGEPVDMDTIPHILDKRYCVQRISPADLLWPINFTGANFDNAPWIGRSGRITWAEAVQKWDLKESDKDSVLGEDRPMLDKLTHDVERDKVAADDMVPFDEIFYKDYQYDSEAKSFSTIHHLVYVGGKDKPVVDEPWNGQKVNDQDHSIVGAQLFPLRVLTLTYITDETIPPSDSAIGRPQVNEINKARTQMIRQRERSLPVRTFDVNRLDPAVQQSLMRGTWQAMIPVQGDGSRIITEVSRAAMPQENFKFQEIAKADLNEEWTIAQPGLEVNSGKGDPQQNAAGNNTQVGRERAKVASLVVGIAQTLGGLMCLYEDPASFGEGFTPAVSKVLKCSILADSTLLLDSKQKLARLNEFVNTYAKSGWINVEPVLQEIATLTGLDPAIVIKAPSPKPPVEPNISLRLTGVEDMLNPLALAFLIKSGQAPGGDLIEQAKGLIQQAVTPPQGMDAPSFQKPGGFPMLPGGQPPPGAGEPGAPQAGQAPPGAPLPPPTPGPPPGSPTPPPQPPKLGEAHPNWTTMPALDKRTEGNQK